MKTKQTKNQPQAQTEPAKPRSVQRRGSTAPIHDTEITAIGTVLKALKPLDYKARDRVIEYATSWCKDPARAPGQ
jgi:hypothetical protein